MGSHHYGNPRKCRIFFFFFDFLKVKYSKAWMKWESFLPLLALVFAPDAPASVPPILWSCSCCSLWIMVSSGLGPSTACSLTTWFRPDRKWTGKQEVRNQVHGERASSRKNILLFVGNIATKAHWQNFSQDVKVALPENRFPCH